MPTELNQQQVSSALRIVLAAGGPIAAIILQKTGVSQGDYEMYVSAALVLVPPVVVAIWGWYSNRKVTQVANIAMMSAADQAAALNKVPDVAKVQIAQALPDVATIVVKNDATGPLATLAASDAHPNIVTEAENAADVKAGTKP